MNRTPYSPSLFLGAFLSLCMGAGCSEPAACNPEEYVGDHSGDFVPLVDNTRWSDLDESEDPFASQRPEDAFCPPGSWYPEDGSLEVDTGLCSWFSGVQPAQADVACGDEVKVTIWHSDLASPDPGDGYVVLTVGSQLLWEKTVAIPSDANVYEMRWKAEFPVEAGESIYFHVHNHGANVWNLLSLESRSH